MASLMGALSSALGRVVDWLGMSRTTTECRFGELDLYPSRKRPGEWIGRAHVQIRPAGSRWLVRRWKVKVTSGDRVLKSRISHHPDTGTEPLNGIVLFLFDNPNDELVVSLSVRFKDWGSAKQDWTVALPPRTDG